MEKCKLTDHLRFPLMRHSATLITMPIISIIITCITGIIKK